MHPRDAGHVEPASQQVNATAHPTTTYDALREMVILYLRHRLSDPDDETGGHVLATWVM